MWDARTDEGRVFKRAIPCFSCFCSSTPKQAVLYVSATRRSLLNCGAVAVAVVAAAAGLSRSQWQRRRAMLRIATRSKATNWKNVVEHGEVRT